jgi:acetyl-CoA carboxylase carboxyl transferase subunit beta
MAVSDEVWMLENSVYSILSPEGYASILWKDSSLAKDAAGVMKMTAKDLYDMKIIDGVIKEPEKFTGDTMYIVVEQLKSVLECFLAKQLTKSGEEIAEERYSRFRSM